MKTTYSRFEALVRQSGNEVGTSLLLILAWIATSDGGLDRAETQRLESIAEASKYRGEIPTLLQLARNHDIEALALASQVIRRHFVGHRRVLFLQLAIGMAIADRYLLPSENHILRFLADLIGMGTAGLESVFLDITGKPLPAPEDLSTAEYWSNRAQGSERQHRDTSPLDEAFSVLGLSPGVTKEAIRLAYRRLAQIHHPDRFASLGEEAVATATTNFQSIKSAYELLMKHA